MNKLIKRLIYLAALVTFSSLALLLVHVFIKGLPGLAWDLFALEYTTENLSLTPAIVNTLLMIVISLALAVPIGVFSAIYLVEYSHRSNRLVAFIRITTETLAGIPSIIYGLFGMLFFVSYLRMGYSLLSGSLTLSIMVLPIIIRTTEEALMSVAPSLREASYALGANKVRTIFKVVLPAASSGILSGIILSIGRIVGETAALIYTAGTVAQLPSSVFSSGRSLAVHMYALSVEGLNTDKAYATALILILITLLINSLSAKLSSKLTKESKDE